VNDYPAAITAANHVEPAPRRIRAFLAGEKVLDTTRALYVTFEAHALRAKTHFFAPAGSPDTP
jgi:hypothetical protein